MTKEDKELILKDLCARSFYSVKVTVPIMSFIEGQGPYTGPIELVSVNAVDMTCTVGDRYAQISGIKMFNRGGELVCKPYLRPMSSMTEEEKREYNLFFFGTEPLGCDFSAYAVEHLTLYDFDAANLIDWLNAHHFDYRGLIEKGLALEAQEGMYGKKEE